MGKHKTPAEREIALRVGARIRQLREIQHISQIHLATDIGIRAGPLGWIEKGKHLPSGRVLYRIAKHLSYPLPLSYRCPIHLRHVSLLYTALLAYYRHR